LKTKILFILPTLHAGGAENYLLRFLSYCKDHFPIEATVLSINEEKGDLHEEYRAQGCTIIYQSISYLNPIRFYRFYQLLRSEKFDAICTFTGNFGGIPIFISYLAGVKKRIAWHRRSSNAFGSNIFKKTYSRSVGYLLLGCATNILSNSKEALSYFYGQEWSSDKRMKIIPNGIAAENVQTLLSKEEARSQLGIPPEAFIIGHIGRFTIEKNHLAIFKLIKELQKEYKNVIGLFCGRGTDSEQFLNQQKECGIEDRCINLGQRRDIDTVLKTIDIFFFPSVSEGNPNALIEAMLAGCSIIASDIGPHKECTPKEYNKYMVPCTDTALHLNMVKKLLQNGSKNFGIDMKSFAESRFNANTNFNLFTKEIE
jgi:glycosyltransferase involved in cell wall biosynthesis